VKESSLIANGQDDDLVNRAMESNGIHVTQCNEMSTQKATTKASRESLPDETKRAIVDYIQHHTDQKFSTYCNQDIATFGKSCTKFRKRVQQFHQDLVRPQKRERLNQLIEEYKKEREKNRDQQEENNDATHEKITAMLRSGTLRKMVPPKPTTKKPQSSLKKKSDSEVRWNHHDLEFYESSDDDADDVEESIERQVNAKKMQVQGRLPIKVAECKFLC
jgi:hypothetical protein